MSSTRCAGDGRRRLMAESKHSAHSGAHGCCGSHGAHGEGNPPGLAVDPVCGLTVDPQKTAHHARSEEHTSELQSLMRISYAVFFLHKQYIHNKLQTP